MKVRIHSDVKTDAISANLLALSQVLAEAAARSREAWELTDREEFDAAIGAVLGLDEILDSAKALYGAALTLHQTAST